MGMCVSCSGGKVSLRHDQREYTKGKYPKNIDESRGHLNEYYVKCDTTIERAFNDFFKDSVEEYNAKQTRTDRKKENYYDELKHSKNKETLVYEYVLQIGNKDNVQGLQDEEKVVDCLREYAEQFQEKNPNFHVVSLAMHRDEATPHLHISFIPYAEGYKTGLDKRCSTSKALESMGYKGQERNMKSWKRTQENELEKLMQKRGLEREVLHTTRGRVDTEVYKETKDRALNDVKPELDRLTIKKENAKKQLAYTTECCEEKKAELQHAENMLNIKTAVLDSKKKDLDIISSLYDAKKRKIDSLDHDINAKKEELANIPSPEVYRQKSTEARKELLGLQEDINTTQISLKDVQADLERCREEQKELINGINQLKALKANLSEQIQEAKQILQELSGNIRETVRSIFTEAIGRIKLGVNIAKNQSFGIDTNFTVAKGMETIEKDGHDRADQELHKFVSNIVKEKLSEEIDKAEEEIADEVQEYVPHRHGR